LPCDALGQSLSIWIHRKVWIYNYVLAWAPAVVGCKSILQMSCLTKSDDVVSDCGQAGKGWCDYDRNHLACSLNWLLHIVDKLAKGGVKMFLIKFLSATWFHCCRLWQSWPKGGVK
jgi:hypothetical protein